MDTTDILQAEVSHALADGIPLWIRGGNSKAFYGNPAVAACRELDTQSHTGVIDYVPEELMIRVRSGTPLFEVQKLLDENGQMLPFEPPDFGGKATIGGVVAAGLSGPRRPWSGAVRDFVLGVTLLTGQAKVLSFGGQVMKNVAGYDVSRLVVGAMGTLGLILDISLKVLPRPESEVTLRVCPDDFRYRINKLFGASIGLSAHAYLEKNLYIRVNNRSGIDGDKVDNSLWHEINNHQLPVLQHGQNLWRISVPQSASEYLTQASVIEWGGALRWVADPTDDPHQIITTGHATLFRSSDVMQRNRFHPLDPVVARIHRNLKQHFDPRGIFNPDRLTWRSNADQYSH